MRFVELASIDFPVRGVKEMVERILHPHTWLLHTGGCVYLFINIAAEWGSSCLQARLDTTKSKKHRIRGPASSILTLRPPKFRGSSQI